MNSILSWFTKERTIIFGFIITLLFTLLYFNIPYKFLCTSGFLYCGDILKFLKILFLITPFIFVMSCLYFFTKEDYFYNWKKFTFIYFIIYLFILILAPSSGGDFIKLTKGVMGVFFSFLYFLLSLIILIYYSLKK